MNSHNRAYLHAPSSSSTPVVFGSPVRQTIFLMRLLVTAFFSDACHFPSRWEGSWFQSGVRQPIVIEHSRLNTKGRCIASEGDKFVVVDE